MSNSKTPPSFQIGQCYTSEGEPELGIGFVKAMDATTIAIEYPTPSLGRLYRKKQAPLRRLEFRVGEKIQSKTGQTFIVDRVEIRQELNWYIASDGTELCESELSPKLTLQRPLERFLAGHWDALSAFSLRRRTLDYYYRHLRSPARGMIGPRAQLLPHQVYVTQEICRRGLPRALLADEVGLGKTIEAGWIMHRLLATERIRRVLILVPESLVNQWFVELFRRFHLSFWVPASQTEETLEVDDIAEQERVILSIESVAILFADGKLKAEDWDLVIVDEAHRIRWSEEQPSAEYEVLKSLAEKSNGLLLLTATPEQLGLDGHYSRLHLIDPQRFASLAAFKKEHAQYQKVAESISPSAPRAEVLSLIDEYGTGRVYFRNSRSVVQLEQAAFPRRNLKTHALDGKKVSETNEAMVQWLAQFTQGLGKEKALLICSSAKQVMEWEKRLRDDFALKVVAFHEELSLLARDRNAAYFEDPQGATLLLCSEIGGEGRNFQHAAHLILADLPEDPDVLEQRIGRLDRIGQASDISIHVPFIPQSHTERLLRWHDEVFHGFSMPPKGAHEVYLQHQPALHALQDLPGTKANEKLFLTLLHQAKQDYEKQLAQIEAGRDRLIEINSFDPVEGPRLAQFLEAAEHVEELKKYFDDLLDAMGLHSDDLDADSLFVDPGHGQYVSYFPGLPPEGLSFTFSRAKALRRTDLSLMTWDHPMVSETLAQLVGQEFGNVAVATWPKNQMLVEANFIFEAAPTEAQWYADEFFPSTPIRIVLEASGQDLTAQLDWETLQKMLAPPNAIASALVKKLPGERVRGLLQKALGQAQGLSTPLKQNALRKMETILAGEMGRLKMLQAKNKIVSDHEIRWWQERQTRLIQAFSGAQIRLDSFLLVVPAQWGNES